MVIGLERGVGGSGGANLHNLLTHFQNFDLFSNFLFSFLKKQIANIINVFVQIFPNNKMYLSKLPNVLWRSRSGVGGCARKVLRKT